MFGMNRDTEEVGVDVLITRDEKHVHMSFAVEGTGHLVMVQVDRLEMVVNPETGTKLQAVLERLTDLVEQSLKEVMTEMKEQMEERE